MKYNLEMSDYVTFILCCGYFVLGYFLFEKSASTIKSKSWIISMLTSPILSIFGLYYATMATYKSLWTIEYIYSENVITRAIIIFFTASNVMDLAVGVFYYPKHLDILMSYFHHLFYTAFMAVILFSNYSRGFVICFCMELPTFILALGTVYDSLRNDKLFGISFFFTRILFNAYQAYMLRQLHPDGMIWKTCVVVLCFHLYWFETWWRKYGVTSVASSCKKAH